MTTLRLRRFAGFTPVNTSDRIRDRRKYARREPERQWRPAGDHQRFRYFLPMYGLFLAIRSTEHFRWPRRRLSPRSRA
jgi:hypothetical protein